jgi:RepB DNA-primase from phage plasmid
VIAGCCPASTAFPPLRYSARLALLKYRNVRGSHIYIRPSGEHHFTTLDDLNVTSIARLSADGFNPCAVVETSAGNFQAWLKHPAVFPQLLSTFAAQTLAARYDADPSAADWRRFGRLPGFTNCKPKYRKPDGLFPFVRLKSHSGEQYPMAETFVQEITKLYQEREQEREARHIQASLSPQRGPRLSNLSLERFRTATKYRDRPAAADIAFCVAAYANGMTADRIERALDDEYLSRDPSLLKRAAYIRRTMEKARRWAEL